MSIVIFDLDGTLANIDHRLKYVRERNYEKFFAECVHDTPIEVVCDLLRMLYCVGGVSIYIVSGRSDEVRTETEVWLAQHSLPHARLYMRKAGDHRADVVVKREILREIQKENIPVLFSIDDRQSVVDMWRSEGITCFQCASWKEFQRKSTTLTLLIGPAGAGKSSFLAGEKAVELGIHPSHVISSDQIRADICGNFRDQTQNKVVFEVLHQLVTKRLELGLPTVVDATNIKRSDRLTITKLGSGHKIRYIVINRSMKEKRESGEWRNELGFDLMQRHEDIFNSNLPDILAGDGNAKIKVIDLRKK